MSQELLYRIVTLLRLAAFMVFVYLLFGLVVERYSRRPDSQLRAFARIICSPVTRPVERLLTPGAEPRRVLRVALGVVAALWLVFVVAARALRPG